jgi:hypothetical protein
MNEPSHSPSSLVEEVASNPQTTVPSAAERKKKAFELKMQSRDEQRLANHQQRVDHSLQTKDPKESLSAFTSDFKKLKEGVQQQHIFYPPPHTISQTNNQYTLCYNKLHNTTNHNAHHHTVSQTNNKTHISQLHINNAHYLTK